jgi:hypothetical protein
VILVEKQNLDELKGYKLVQEMSTKENLRVCFDSNILTKITMSSSDYADFVKKVESLNATLVCLSDVAVEGGLGGDFEHVCSRFQSLVKLFSRNPKKFKISPIYSELIKREVNAKKVQNDFGLSLTLRTIEFWSNSRNIQKIFEGMDQNRKDHRAFNEEFKRSYKGIRNKSPKQKESSNVFRRIIDSYNGILSSAASIDMSLSSMPPQFKSSKRLLRKIEADASRYRCTRAYLNILNLRHFLTVISDGEIPAGLEKTHEIKGNDLIDVGIGAAAAYSNILITNDEGLYQLINFLFERNLLSQKALTFPDFINYQKGLLT